MRHLVLGLITALSLTSVTTAASAEPPFEAALIPKRGCLHAQKPCLPLVLYCVDSCNNTMRFMKLGAFDKRSLYVRGRLRGGLEGQYKLEMIESGHAFAIAYLGRSIRNRPIVDTVQGEFEIGTIELDVLQYAPVIAINRTNGEVLARYIVDQIVFSKAGEGGRWDNTQQKCISAPQYLPGLLRDMTDECRAAESKTVFGSVGGAIVELRGADRTYLDDGLYVAAYRVRGTHITIALPERRAH